MELLVFFIKTCPHIKIPEDTVSMKELIEAQLILSCCELRKVLHLFGIKSIYWSIGIY